MLSIFELIVASDIVGSVVLLSISFFSLKAMRGTGVNMFLFFFLGFALLAAGRLSHSLVFITLALTRPAKIIVAATSLTASFVALISEVLAYLLIAIGYSRHARHDIGELGTSSIAVVAGRQIFIQAVGEVLNFFLLIYIVFQALAVYLSGKKRGSLMILLGFTLFLASHLTRFISLLELSERLFIASKFVYFAGMVFFLAMVVEVAVSR